MSTPKIKMLFSVIRRRFASSIHGFGAKLNVESVKTTATQKFHELRTLPDIEAVKQAPEGSVVVTDSEVPTDMRKVKYAHNYNMNSFLGQKIISNCAEMIQSFKRVESDNTSRFARLETEILNLKAENLKQDKNIEALQKNVEELKIIPSAIQIFETVLNYQKVLIRKYLPDIYVVLHKRDLKFNFLRGKDSQLIRNFFKLSHVEKLDSFITSKEFMRIVDFRNKKAHEAISDIVLLSANFEDISGYFQSVSKDFDSDSFKFEKIKDIHEHVQDVDDEYES